jgi:hypothetical protein
MHLHADHFGGRFEIEAVSKLLDASLLVDWRVGLFSGDYELTAEPTHLIDQHAVAVKLLGEENELKKELLVVQ